MKAGEILQSTKFVLQGLDALKHEHEKILENIDHTSDMFLSNKTEEQLLLRKSMDTIDLGIAEAQVMMQLEHHLQNLEAEKHKLSAQVKLLCQENTWLRDELGNTQKKFHDCEQINTSYSVEIEHLKYLKEIKQVDSSDSFIKQEDLTNDLFPIDEYVQSKIFDSYNNLLTLPTNSSDNYNISIRLKTLHNLVIQYASEGRYEIAIPLCRQALEDLEKTTGHLHPDVATMLNILALVYRDQSKFKEAITLLNDALSIREKTLGPEHPAVAATLNNLAVLYGKRNKFKEAEILCKRALEIREKCLSSYHPDLAKQLNNLALLCQNLGKYAEAEIYFERVINIYVQSFGLNDPNVAKTKNNLASIYLKQQKYKEAERLYKEVLGSDTDSSSMTNEKHLGQDHWNKNPRTDLPTVSTTLKNLSILYRQQGRYDIADSIENYLSHARDDTQAIAQALDIVQQTNNLS